MGNATDSLTAAADYKDSSGWTTEQNFRQVCMRCHTLAIVCCGFSAIGHWICVDCCDHPWRDEENDMESE